MSIFSDALGTVIDEIHRAEGSPVVTFYTVNGDPVSVKAVFDAQGILLDLATGVFQRTNQPWLGVRLSDLPHEPLQGDPVQVAGINYAVTDIDEDGQGGARLSLRLA